MHYEFVAIEGNIGAGKTTLAKQIADALGRKLLLESFENNPFLPKFYNEPSRYAFPLELFFLAERFQQLGDLLSNPDLFKPGYVSDYFIHKSLIFARYNLNNDEFRLFQRLFEQMHQSLPKPDLLVYLYRDVAELQNNIVKRARHFEQGISNHYLKEIQKGYLKYLEQQAELRIVVVNCCQVDFTPNSSATHQVLQLLESDFERGINHITL